MEAKLFIFQQIKEMLELAMKRNAHWGPINEAKKSLVDNVLIASSPNLVVGPNQILIPDPQAPSSRMIANALGFKKSTGCRLLNQLQDKRHALRNTVNAHRWLFILKRKRKSARKVNPEICKAVCNWIVNHPNVVHSPIASDTILVKTLDNAEKTRVGKLLLEIPVRELHNEMVAADTGLADARDQNTGKVCISNTTLRRIIKQDLPHLRRMTLWHKLMCGCETCISIATMQRSLNSWRRRRLQQMERETNLLGHTRAREVALHNVAEYRNYVLEEDKPRHEKPRHALEEIMCKSHDCGHHHWNCVLGRCDNCPSYKIHRVEQDLETKIKFHYYENATKCSKHGDLNLRVTQCDHCNQFPIGKKKGQVRTRKHLALKEEAIEDFLNEFYIPKLKEYRYHLPHVKILSHNDCSRLRNEYFRTFPYNVKSRRDYAERLSGHFNLEIQSAHFGQGRDVSIEGSSIRACTTESLQQYERGEINEENIERTLETHSHFSDDSRQDASTTHAHMDLLIKRLKEDGRIKESTTKFLEETDGCSKQYRCATACFLLSLLATTHKIVIDRAIGAPGHGKDEVDGLNATDKRYLSEKMSVTYEPEVKEAVNRMAPEARENGESKSFARECVRLCSLPDRFEGVKSEGKSKKREDNRKMRMLFYHEQKAEDVLFGGLKYEMKGLQTGMRRNGLMARYNIRADPDLGIGKIAVRRIPCACNGCIEQLEMLWVPGVKPAEQGRYATSKTCHWRSIFFETEEKGLNDWVIADLFPKKESSEEEEEEAYMIYIQSLAEEAKREIGAGKTGAFATEDQEFEGYYLVEWVSEPRVLDEPMTLAEYEPPIHLPIGELVCNAIYLDRIPGAKRWWYRTDILVTVRLQQVLIGDLNLLPQTPLNKPGGASRRLVTAHQAKKLSEEDHLRLADEIGRREIANLYEEEDDIGEESDDGEDEDDEGSDSNNEDD
jgi:hypothetical protein